MPSSAPLLLKAIVRMKKALLRGDLNCRSVLRHFTDMAYPGGDTSYLANLTYFPFLKNTARRMRARHVSEKNR